MPETVDTRARLVVLISGNGTNLQAILDACTGGKLPARVAAVVSNRKDAYGLLRAQKAGVPTHYLPLKPYTDGEGSRETYDHDLAEVVAGYDPHLVILAGWMHILSGAFIERFDGRLINLHPALPGLFAGTHAIERAFQAFQRGEIEFSGAMVHHVVPAVDEGPVVDSIVVPFLPNDKLSDFEERMHAYERLLLVRAVGRLLAGQSEPATSGA